MWGVRTPYIFALLITLLGAAFYLDNPRVRAEITRSGELAVRVQDLEAVLENLKWVAATGMVLRDMQSDSIVLWKSRYFFAVRELSCLKR